MSRSRDVVSALAAGLITFALAVGVPVLLVVSVGNPWPGRARIEMRDEVALIVGLLAVVAWVVWARFLAAVIIEARHQFRVLRRQATVEPTSRVELAAPVVARGGIGLLAQRLVAAMLIVLPLAAELDPAVAEAPVPLRRDSAVAELLVEPAATSPRGAVTVSGGATSAAPAASWTVLSGDTLIGLARAHLGDAGRWREIFELNRERVQPDGHRLDTPSALRAGWTLMLPAGALPDGPPHVAQLGSYVGPETITIQVGDNLWDLSEERLREAGAPSDDASVAAHLDKVIVENAAIIEDPNMVYVGEQFAFPAVGTAPPAPVHVPVQPPVEAPPAVVAPAAEAPAEPPATSVTPDRRTIRADILDAALLGGVAAATVETPAAEDASEATATTTTLSVHAPLDVEPDGIDAEMPSTSPSPIGIGEAALLSAGVLALLAARRRLRLRASLPRARVPEPPSESVATERRLRTVDAGERLVRVDVAVRAAAASLITGDARIAVVRVGTDGVVELTLTSEASLPGPWEGDCGRWVLPGSIPIELLAAASRSVGAPCVALTQVGVDTDGREVLVDLEALGLLSIVAPPVLADSVVRGIAATLGTSVFAELANLIGVGLDHVAFLDHRQAHHASTVEDAVELAATLVGTTVAAKQSTFALRARHTSGEAWEPAVVLTGSSVADEITPELVRTAARRRGGLAMVVAADAPAAPWSLRAESDRWTLEPLGISLVPVGLTLDELDDLQDVLRRADDPLLLVGPDRAENVAFTGHDEQRGVPIDADGAGTDEPLEPPWSLLVRLLGPVQVVDRRECPARFERSKTLELIAWLTLHRDRSTRSGARTALWELDVRDATFANVVSEARRAMARHVPPPDGTEWLGRTLTEVLPLHSGVVADVDLVRARLERARVQPPELAIETLRPAVELVRDMPFAGTGYLWPDAEGITSNLVLLATSAATELAGHYLSMSDIDGVFWATGQGLKVLPGHEELIALRMRAHAGAGDLSGVRLEWESYERVLNADPWSDGEPAPKLLMLRRELLSS